MAPSYPRIFLSGHALQRKREGRDYIDESLVREVLRDPTNELPNPKGRRKFWKQIDDKIYTVVIEEANNGTAAHVITVWAKDPIA